MAPLIKLHAVSKRTANFLILFNILFAIIHCCSILLTLNSHLILDVINRPLHATIWNILVVSCCVFTGYFISTANTVNGIGVKISSVLKGLLFLVGSTLFFHTLAILYGAPVTESVGETFHFSLLLSTTAVLPPCVFLGLSLHSWIRVFAHNSAELGPELVVYTTTICSIIGAWLGAFPIPLDWDRPWQVWPVSCLLGTLFGYDFGMVLSAVLLYYRYHVTHKSKTF